MMADKYVLTKRLLSLEDTAKNLLSVLPLTRFYVGVGFMQ